MAAGAVGSYFWQGAFLYFCSLFLYRQQEAQLMLTNPRDAFRGQSRSPNIVPFHMLGIVFSCPIVTLSLRQYLGYSTSKMSSDLEDRVRDPSTSFGNVTMC